MSSRRPGRAERHRLWQACTPDMIIALNDINDGRPPQTYAVLTRLADLGLVEATEHGSTRITSAGTAVLVENCFQTNTKKGGK